MSSMFTERSVQEAGGETSGCNSTLDFVFNNLPPNARVKNEVGIGVKGGCQIASRFFHGFRRDE